MLADNSAEEVISFLSAFSSKHNLDIEQFLKNDAIDFSNRGIARTHLVVARCNSRPVLLGYFTLANKVLLVPRGAMSNTVEKRVSRFGPLNKSTDTYSIPAPLIAQLGKNYANDDAPIIKGDILLGIALERVAAIEHELGGKLTYIECEDTPKLINFYERNGFRRIDGGSPDILYGASEPYLVQMLKFFQ